MRCPFCSYEESKVVDSRPTEEGSSIRRRRECLKCGKRFTTYEKIESMPLMVSKKDNSIQPFDRNKLLSGIMRACQKRPISMQLQEKIVDEIESTLANSLEKEVRSEKIGEMVMQKLKETDDVAYVRFASVYRQFKDINTFMHELTKILEDKEQ